MKTPEIAENVFTAPDAVILGDVQIEEECSIWFHAVVRAEAESIRIGRGSNIQDNAVIHVDASTDRDRCHNRPRSHNSWLQHRR